MQIKMWMSFCSPQNISGVFKQYSTAAFSKTTDVDRDLFSKFLKNNISLELIWQNPSLQKPQDPKLIWKYIIHTRL